MNRSGLMALALLVASAARLPADEIRLRSGGRLEGLVREESPESVVIETSSGLVSVSRRDIETIDRFVRSVLREYYDREAAARTASDLLALADWASENKLTRFV